MKNFSSLKEEICLECSLTEATQVPTPPIEGGVDVESWFRSCKMPEFGTPLFLILYWYMAYAGVYLDHGEDSEKSFPEQKEERLKFFYDMERLGWLDEYPQRNPNIQCISNALVKVVNTPISAFDTNEDPLNRRTYSYGSSVDSPIGIDVSAPADFQEIWKELPGNTLLMREVEKQARLDSKRHESMTQLPRPMVQRIRETDPYNHQITYDKHFFNHILQSMADSDEVYETNTLRDPVLQLAMMGDPKGPQYANMPKIKFSKTSYGSVHLPIRGQYEQGEPDRITLNYIRYLFNDGPNGVQGLARTLAHEFRHRAFNIIFDNDEIYKEMPPELKQGGKWYGSWGGNYNGGPDIKGENGETVEHAMIYCQDQEDVLNSRAASFVTFFNQDLYPPAYWRDLYAKVSQGVGRYLAQFAKVPTRRPTTGIPPHIKLPDASPEEVKRRAEKNAKDMEKRHLLPKLQSDAVVREMYNRLNLYEFGSIDYNPNRAQTIASIINRLDSERGAIEIFLMFRFIALKFSGDKKEKQLVPALKRLLGEWELEVSMKGNWYKAKIYPQRMLRISKAAGADLGDNEGRLEDCIKKFDELEREIKKKHPEGWKYFSYDYIEKYLRRNPDYDPFNPTGEPTPPVNAPKPVAPTPTTPVTPATPATPISSGRGTPATAPPEEKKNPWENIFISSRKRRTGPRQPSSPTTIERPVDKKLIEKIRDIIDNIRKEKPYLGDRALIAGAVVAVVAGGFFAFRKYLFDRKTQRVASTVLRDPKSRDMIQDLRKRERRRVLELLKDKNFRERVLAEV